MPFSETIGPPFIGSRRVGPTLSVAGALAAWLVVFAGEAPRYHDDSHASLGSAKDAVEVRGDQGLKRLKFTPQTAARSTVIDARRAVFLVANSRNAAPTAAKNCDKGNLPINRYPLVIEQVDHAAVVGGLFLSHVPQASEWQATYCNSAAITFQQSGEGVIDGVRITGAWDAIRVGRDSPGMVIANSWITDARDDAIENDFLQAASLRDTLIDGAFQGISVKPRKGNDVPDASRQLVSLSGVMLRLTEYRYKEGRRFGALLKTDQRAPRVRMVNSVVAVDDRGGQSYPQFWQTGWTKLIDSSNNLFLWLSDTPAPDFVQPPASFRMLRGQAARDAWSSAKTNWINCHPRLARLPSDPRSDPGRCIAETWGGFTD